MKTITFLLTLMSIRTPTEATFDNPFALIWRNISDGYDRNFRPVRHAGTSVSVNVTNSLYRMVQLSESDESLTMIFGVHWVSVGIPCVPQ